jgi:cobalt transporter subunit CbtB
MTSDAHTVRAALAERADPRLAAAIALALGAIVVFGAGFAAPSALHNAAHDTRHSFAFPCH